MDEGIDFVLHYGDGDHLYFIPHAKDAEDAMRYFFCIEGYGQSRQFGLLRPEVCLIVPLRDDLQDRDAFERRIAQLRHDLQVQQEAAEGL